jgi:hypothetical protein
MLDQGLRPRIVDRVLEVTLFGADDSHSERSAKSLTRTRSSKCNSSWRGILGSGAQHVSLMAMASAGLAVLEVSFAS